MKHIRHVGGHEKFRDVGRGSGIRRKSVLLFKIEEVIACSSTSLIKVLSMSVSAACRITPASFCLCLFPLSTSTTGSSTWHLLTMMDFVNIIRSARGCFLPDALWVWCSSTMCCRTWREASRQRSCGSAFPWRWQPSPLKQHPEQGCAGPGPETSLTSPT